MQSDRIYYRIGSEGASGVPQDVYRLEFLYMDSVVLSERDTGILVKYTVDYFMRTFKAYDAQNN